VSLLTLPYLTRVLSPEAYGVAAMANASIYFVAVLAIAGIDMSYVRAYHSVGNEKVESIEAFVWRFTLASGLAFGAIGALTWVVVAKTVFDLPAYLGGIIGLGILLAPLNTMALTRARLSNRYRAMSGSNVVAALGVAAVSMGVATWWRQDALPLVLAILVGNLIPILVLGMPGRDVLTTPSGFSRQERRLILSVGLAGIVTAPMYWVLSSMDRWILGYIDGAASVGIYSIGYNVAVVSLLLNTAIQSVWLPEATREYERQPESAAAVLGPLAERFIVALALMWLAVTAAGGDAIRLLVGSEFYSASSLVPLIALGAFFYGVLQLANAALIIKKKLHHAIWWWVAGAIICLGLNILLVPKLGRIGSAITQACSFGVVAIGIVISAQRCMPVKIRSMRLVITLCAIVIAGVAMHGPWAASPLHSLMLKFPVGLVCVAVFVSAVMPEAFAIMRNRMSKVWQ
jgi:O-antigen/teichoic acid export membrane protein